jgi:hypothetical protein
MISARRRLKRWCIAFVLLFGLWLVLAIASCNLAHAQEADEFSARITFYTQTGTMASGIWTRKDAAACSQWMPFGTQLRFPDGYVVTCLDRGHGDWYWPAWVDVHAENYAWGIENVERPYGLWSTVRVLRWGYGDE